MNMKKNFMLNKKNANENNWIPFITDQTGED